VSDEAITNDDVGDCFALLAMTYAIDMRRCIIPFSENHDHHARNTRRSHLRPRQDVMGEDATHFTGVAQV